MPSYLTTALAISLATCLLLSARFYFPAANVQQPAEIAPPLGNEENLDTKQHLQEYWEDEMFAGEDANEPKYHNVFGNAPGGRVFGWPKKDGVYVLDNVLGVELDFLSLDRFESSERFEDQAEEEAHCDKIRLLGSTWWRSTWDLGRYHAFRLESGDDLVSIVGVLADGGVWVLHGTRMELGNLGAARIYNARDMVERCRLIEKLGGKFFNDPKECPHLDL